MNSIELSDYGEIPKNWEIKKLVDISERVTDGSHFSPKPQSTGYYMCSVKDMLYDRFDFTNSKLISREDFIQLVQQDCSPQKNDVLISKDGANCLDLIFLYNQKEKIVLLSSIAIVRLKNDVEPKYIRYFLLSPDCQYLMRNNFVSGSAIPRVVLRDFKNVPIVLPSLPEQKAIAGVLSSLDDKIDLLQRQNKTLEQLAQTLFRQWFIEEAKDEWEECSLYDSIKLVGGGTPKTVIEEYWNGDIPWLSGADISKNHKNFILTSEKKISDSGLQNSSAKLMPAKATVITARGTVGKYCILSKPMTFSQTNYGVLPKYENCFYFNYLLIDHSVSELLSAAYGSVFDTITTRTFMGFFINIPSEREIKEFEKQVSPFFDRMLLNQNQIRTLETLRDTLLPKLISGEVRVQY